MKELEFCVKQYLVLSRTSVFKCFLCTASRFFIIIIYLLVLNNVLVQGRYADAVGVVSLPS